MIAKLQCMLWTTAEAKVRTSSRSYDARNGPIPDCMRKQNTYSLLIGMKIRFRLKKSVLVTHVATFL